jgi:hypothetical protein
MIAIIPEPLIGIPGTLIGIVRNPHRTHGWAPGGGHCAPHYAHLTERFFAVNSEKISELYHRFEGQISTNTCSQRKLRSNYSRSLAGGSAK